MNSLSVVVGKFRVNISARRVTRPLFRAQLLFSERLLPILVRKKSFPDLLITVQLTGKGERELVNCDHR